MNSLLALGDSHLEALKFASELGILESVKTEFCIVPGATAVGLRNPNSQTNALAEFRKAIERVSNDTYILTHLGEVDCGFVMWWRMQKYGESIEKQLRDSLDAYYEFILGLKNAGFSKVCISGASLPTIRDEIDFGDVANKRKDIRTSLYERTKLTHRYNQELNTIADTLGYDFFDIANAVTNKADGLISDFFRNPDPCDHHLDPQKTVGIWAKACNEFITRKNSITPKSNQPYGPLGESN